MEVGALCKKGQSDIGHAMLAGCDVIYEEVVLCKKGQSDSGHATLAGCDDEENSYRFNIENRSNTFRKPFFISTNRPAC
jgi:hypothetical protein